MNLLPGFATYNDDGTLCWYKFDSKPGDGTVGCKKIGTLSRSKTGELLIGTNMPNDGLVSVSIIEQIEEY